MPIKVQKDLPAKEILEHENIFVMDEERAHHQDIRPLEILMLNLMPTKEETELQMLRCLSNSPLQVDVTFMMVSSHESKNTSISHLNRFYQYFDDIKNRKFDGMIITGAPIEHLEFEEVDFWEEFKMILDWADKNVTSTVFQCWGAQAAMYYFYGLKKRPLKEKLFGIYWHRVLHRKIPLVRGFDDVFLTPHSRHTDVDIEDIRKCEKITILAESDEAGFLLGMADDGRKIFIQGHPEYDRLTLDAEYKRDVNKGLEIKPPLNYYKDNDPANKPLLTWRSMSFNLYENWLNYYVYQTTPYNLMGTPEVFNK
jgi:homoserine O-succinyltransferase